MANTNNIDVVLASLIKDNITKIKSTTPVNPPIKKDDEWRNETHWDKLYKELETR